MRRLGVGTLGARNKKQAITFMLAFALLGTAAVIASFAMTASGPGLNLDDTASYLENPPVEATAASANTGTIKVYVYWDSSDGGSISGHALPNITVSSNSFKSHLECQNRSGLTGSNGSYTMNSCPVAASGNGNNYMKRYRLTVQVPNGYRADGTRASQVGFSDKLGATVSKVVTLHKGETKVVKIVLVNTGTTNPPPTITAPNPALYDTGKEQAILNDLNTARDQSTQAYQPDPNCQDLSSCATSGTFINVPQHSLQALTISPLAQSAARRHVEDMIENNYFSHQTPDGKDVNYILDEVGYPNGTVFDHRTRFGENLYYGDLIYSPSSSTGDPQNVINAWLASYVGHRQNMLDNNNFAQVGIGVREVPSFTFNGTTHQDVMLVSAVFITFEPGHQAKAATSNLTPLYDYYSAKGTDHFYTINRNDDGYAAFSYDLYLGCEGQVFNSNNLSSPPIGTRPIYRYFNSTATDHFYTMVKDNPQWQYYGYSYEGIEGYAYPGNWPQPAGTIPLKHYMNFDIGDNYYTTADWPDGYTGYHYADVLAWVIPPPSDHCISTVPLIRYWNAGLTDYYYAKNGWPNGYGGYNIDTSAGDGGVAAHVYPSHILNTVPLHEFFNPSTNTHYYTIDSSFYCGEFGYNCYDPKTGQITNNPTVQGWVYPTQQPGTVPFREFYNPSWLDYFYTTNSAFYCGLFGYQCQPPYVQGYVYP